MKKNIFRSFFSFIILSSFLSTAFSVSAQTRRSDQAKSDQTASSKKNVQKYAGGWSGTVTYRQTLKDSLESDEPGIRKATDRIKHKTSRDYDYTGRAVIDGTDPKNPLVKTSVNFTDADLNWGEEKVFDTCNSRESGHWFIIEGNDDRQTQAQATGSAENFNLSVDELGGTYNFSMRFPKANGRFKREEHVKKSGHCQPKNNEPSDRSTDDAFTIEGGSFSIDSQKIDPENPNVLQGTKIWGDDGTGAVRSFIYQVTWYFTRCPEKLLITDLKFEHPEFPDFENWKEIEEARGTIDGNRVKIKAKVLNLSQETKYADLKIFETYKGDKYNYARPDEPLPEGEISLRLEGGEEREVELIWDTEGQAWFDDSRPHLFHRIKAELAENGEKKDEKEKPVNIAPKPLVLVHGVWEDHKIWEPLYQNLLTESHSYNWKAYPIGSAGEGRMNTGGAFMSGDPADSVYDNAERLSKFIKYAQKESNAWHVDLVAHSTGGLIARLYLQKYMPNVLDARPQVKHLIMLGTPNGGVPCADVFAGKLGFDKGKLQPLKELTNEEMLRFNQYVVNTGGTKLSALAGNSVPVICGGLDWNDGFVTVKSATYNVADTGQSNDLNRQLTDGKNFGNFVKPHLVTGPKKTYPLPVKNDPTDWKRWQLNNRDYDVNSVSEFYQNDNIFAAENLTGNSIASNLFDNEKVKSNGPNIEDAENYSPLFENAVQTFFKEVKLAPKETLEVEVPIENAPNFGVTFMANPGVSVSLINDKGVLVSRNLTDSPLANIMFRTILTNKAVTKSVWKLKLENKSDFQQNFAGFGWSTRSDLLRNNETVK